MLATAPVALNHTMRGLYRTMLCHFVRCSRLLLCRSRFNFPLLANSWQRLRQDHLIAGYIYKRTLHRYKSRSQQNTNQAATDLTLHNYNLRISLQQTQFSNVTKQRRASTRTLLIAPCLPANVSMFPAQLLSVARTPCWSHQQQEPSITFRGYASAHF